MSNLDCILTISKTCSYYEHSVMTFKEVCPHRLVVLGHLSFTEVTGIQVPLGVGYYERKVSVDYQ